MATTSLKDFMVTFFSVPMETAITTEKEYINMWIKVLKNFISNTDAKPEDLTLSEVINALPKINFDGRVDMAVTMKISSLTQKRGGAGISLSAGAVSMAGSYGFVSQQAQESIFKAATSFVMSNHATDLDKLARENGIKPEEAGSLFNTVSLLEKLQKAIPEVDLSGFDKKTKTEQINNQNTEQQKNKEQTGDQTSAQDDTQNASTNDNNTNGNDN